MNDKPHVHKPRLHRKWELLDTSWDNYWQITYGDTRVRVCNGRKLPTPKLVERATRKAIAQHDEGSVWAGDLTKGLAELQQHAENVVSQWGTNGD